MRAWSGAVLLVLAGCPLPEDQFVLSGTVLDEGARPRPDVEVRLLRNQFPSEKRCDALVPLETTRTDAQGRYTFSLVRQQITGGVNARRFFRVESETELLRVAHQTFWFPDADLELGELRAQVFDDQDWRATEARADDHVAWRSELAGLPFVPDRPFQRRIAWGRREWRTVPIDSLGRYDIVPVDWGLETPWTEEAGSGFGASPSRGAECPDLEVTPCPLTDGRFLSYEFPENTRTIVLNFKRETSVSPILFHGLLLAGRAAFVRFEFNFVLDFENWNTLGTAKFDARLQDRAQERCGEPGAFALFNPPNLIKPLLLRVAFLDEAGDLIPIISLAEISTR
jgi:hypothetical protein